jgi:hypothetical protein
VLAKVIGREIVLLFGTHLILFCYSLLFFFFLKGKMNFAGNLLGKAIIKSKTSSIEKSISNATTVHEDPQGAQPEKSRRKKITRELKASLLSLAHSDHGIGFSTMMKERRWVSYTTDGDLKIDNLVRNAFPVSAYRCTGQIKTSATAEQLASIGFDLDLRRKWDLELTREVIFFVVFTLFCFLKKTNHHSGRHVQWSRFRMMRVLFVQSFFACFLLFPSFKVFEYEARGSSMGGVVSGRGYVDLRGRSVKAGEARVFWGSYKWDVEMEDGLVRAWNYTSGMCFRPLGDNVFELMIILHRDVRGWLPYAAAEKAMSGSIAYWWRLLADFIQKQYPA